MFVTQWIQNLQDEYTRMKEGYWIIKQSFAGIRLTRWQMTKLLATQLWRELPPGALTVIVLAGSLALAWAVSTILLRPAQPSLDKLGIPLVGKSKGRKMNFEQLLEDSAKKHAGLPFRIKAFGSEYVVYPSKHFDEIKRLPATQASALAFLQDAFHTSWSGVPRHSEELIKTISVDLTRAIPSLIRERQHDCATACESVIGHCAEWKDVTLYSNIQKIVVSTNSSALVGRELGTDKTWISNVERLPMAVAIPTVVLSLVPVMLRPFLKPIVFAPAIYTSWVLSRLLTPVVKDDMKEYRLDEDKKKVLAAAQAKGKVALTSWLLHRYPDADEKAMTDILLRDYINVSFESTTSTAGTLFYILTELAANPGLADLMREEIRSFAPDGMLPLTHLNELRIMDSVMRESARVNPFSHIILYRRLMQPLKLSVGPELPAGTNICVDAHHINFSTQLWGEDAATFDGLRHFRARQKPGNEQRFKFANLGNDAPGWGDGPQACPGRMFADNTIKIILAHLLTSYDFKFRDGEGKPAKGSMPNGSMYPNMSAKVMFKSR